MSLVARFNAGETLFTAWSGVPDALTVEIVARQGFDAVTLDMQHGGHHEDSVLRGIVPILNAGKHAIVRIPVGRFDMASRALDFGAEAVIAPMINSVEDARRFAAAMKYPPVGERSWGPTFGFPRHGKGDFAEWLREFEPAHAGFRHDRDTGSARRAWTAFLRCRASTGSFSDRPTFRSRGRMEKPSTPPLKA